MERRRGDDRDDDDRGRRGRDDRDDDRRGSSRERDDDRSRDRDRGRDRDDDRGSDRRRSRDDDDRGGSRGGRDFEYQRRSIEDMNERAQDNSKFDKILKPHIKQWKPNSGDNRIRPLPPTWKGAKHYGLDVYVHYGVGPDRQTYLCPNKMRGDPCPICDERARFARDMDPDDKRDKDYLKDLTPKLRVLMFLIDRDHEREGVQAWPMPEGLDKDIVKISVDKTTGAILPVDHPDEGFDITFEKNGQGIHTKYEAPSIARRDSPLGKREWLDYAIDNPLPDQLVFYDADHIAKAFGGGSGPSDRSRDDRDRDGDRGRDRDRDDRGRDRDDGRDRDRGRDDREDRRGSSRDRDEKPTLTWESVHDMRRREMEDLVESENLKIKPKEAKDDEDLADWICEEMGLKKGERSERRRADDSGDRGRDDRDDDDRLARMRERLRD
jgi:hypothetical protein